MAKCTPAKHKAAASHRAAEKKYVAKNPEKHRAAVKKSELKHHGKVLARKRAARKQDSSGGKSSGGKMGRPREC